MPAKPGPATALDAQIIMWLYELRRETEIRNAAFHLRRVLAGDCRGHAAHSARLISCSPRRRWSCEQRKAGGAWSG